VPVVAAGVVDQSEPVQTVGVGEVVQANKQVTETGFHVLVVLAAERGDHERAERLDRPRSAQEVVGPGVLQSDFGLGAEGGGELLFQLVYVGGR
jgi:hypothetical protein